MASPGTSSLATYGGALANYLGQGVIDPTTDLDAAAHNQAMTDLAGLTMTGAKAWAIITAAASPTLVAHSAQWGNSGLVAPVVARTSAGIYTVTWPSTITDALGASQTVVINASYANVLGATLYLSQANKTAANVATVYTWTTGFAASDVGANIIVVAV